MARTKSTSPFQQSVMRLAYDPLAQEDDGARLKKKRTDWGKPSQRDGATDEAAKVLGRLTADWFAVPFKPSSNMIWRVAVQDRQGLTTEELVEERERDLERVDKWLVAKYPDLNDEEDVRIGKEIEETLGMHLTIKFEDGPLGGRKTDPSNNTEQDNEEKDVSDDDSDEDDDALDVDQFMGTDKTKSASDEKLRSVSVVPETEHGNTDDENEKTIVVRGGPDYVKSEPPKTPKTPAPAEKSDEKQVRKPRRKAAESKPKTPVDKSDEVPARKPKGKVAEDKPKAPANKFDELPARKPKAKVAEDKGKGAEKPTRGNRRSTRSSVLVKQEQTPSKSPTKDAVGEKQGDKQKTGKKGKAGDDSSDEDADGEDDEELGDVKAKTDKLSSASKRLSELRRKETESGDKPVRVKVEKEEPTLTKTEGKRKMASSSKDADDGSVKKKDDDSDASIEFMNQPPSKRQRRSVTDKSLHEDKGVKANASVPVPDTLVNSVANTGSGQEMQMTLYSNLYSQNVPPVSPNVMLAASQTPFTSNAPAGPSINAPVPHMPLLGNVSTLQYGSFNYTDTAPVQSQWDGASDVFRVLYEFSLAMRAQAKTDVYAHLIMNPVVPLEELARRILATSQAHGYPHRPIAYFWEDRDILALGAQVEQNFE